MLTYAARRLASLAFVWGITLFLTFFAVRLIPGDPVTLMLGERAGDAAMAAKLRADYGLDQPLPVQLLSYLGGVLDGTFGLSYRFVGSTVIDVIGGGLAITPVLALLALFIATPLGVSLGLVAAIRAGTWTDTLIILVLVAGISVPNFAIAAVLVYTLSVKLALLPVAGWGGLQHLVLPVTVLVIPPTAVVARLTRTYMLEVLGRDYIRTARAKGLSSFRVVAVHALRNALIPVITFLGPEIAFVFCGGFVIEKVFSIPGLGRYFVQSILARDYPVIMGTTIFLASFIILMNLVVDILYHVVDPRIELAGGEN